MVLALELPRGEKNLKTKPEKLVGNSLRKPAGKNLLPNCIEASDGSLPALLLCLLLDQVLGIAIGDWAGFANQSLILQLPARHLLVDALQAEKESAMAKPAPERRLSASPITPLKQQAPLGYCLVWRWWSGFCFSQVLAFVFHATFMSLLLITSYNQALKTFRC